MAKYSPAQKAAVDRYMQTKARINVVVPRERKAAYQQAAQAEGKSLNAFIVDCIEAALRDSSRERAN